MTSVVSRIGTARISSGRSSVATVVPATFQLDARPSAASAKPSTWLPESPMKIAAGCPGRRLNGRKAEAREAEREREHEHEIVAVDGRRVDREIGAGDRRERRGEAVHVVEQVEGVRDPDEPEGRDGDGDDVVREQLDAEPRGDHDCRRAELRGELRHRPEVADVVDQAGHEQQRAAHHDASELERRLDRADELGAGEAEEQAQEDADAAEDRSRPVVPALAGRSRKQPCPERRAQERSESQVGNGQSGDRDGRTHGAQGNGAC